MKFFSKSLSQALQEAGCVATMAYAWDGDELIHIYFNDPSPKKGLKPAFGWWDLCGGSERARENAKKWWGEHEVTALGSRPNPDYSGHPTFKRAWVFHLHALIDLPEDEQEKYVWASMRKENS